MLSVTCVFAFFSCQSSSADEITVRKSEDVSQIQEYILMHPKPGRQQGQMMVN